MQSETEIAFRARIPVFSAYRITQGLVVPDGLLPVTLRDPFATPDAFLDYMATAEGDEKSLLKFATKYGLPWHPSDWMACTSEEALGVEITKWRKAAGTMCSATISGGRSTVILLDASIAPLVRCVAGEWRLEGSVNSLHEAMVIQGAIALINRATIRKCDQCGRQFIPSKRSPPGSRFCSNACRQVNYRARTAQEKGRVTKKPARQK